MCHSIYLSSLNLSIEILLDLGYFTVLPRNVILKKINQLAMHKLVTQQQFLMTAKHP